MKRILITTFLLVLFTGNLAFPLQARAAETEPNVVFGQNVSTVTARVNILYPNGDLWEVLESGAANSAYWDDPKFDTQNLLLWHTKEVTDQWALTEDGRLWVLKIKDPGALAPHRSPEYVLDGVENIYEGYSGDVLFLKKDRTLWSCAYDASQNKAGTPVYLLASVKEIKTDLLGLYAVTNDEKLYFLGGKSAVYLAEYKEIVQMASMRFDYFLKKDGSLWRCNPYQAGAYDAFLEGVSEVYPVYFRMKDGSYLDESKNSLTSVTVPPEKLSGAKIFDRHFITKEGALCLLKTGECIETNVASASDIGNGYLNLFLVVKRDGTLWINSGEEKKSILLMSHISYIKDNLSNTTGPYALVIVGKDGSVWSAQPNKGKKFASYTDAFSPLSAKQRVGYGNPRLFIDSAPVTFDALPFMENGRMLVPVRVVSGQLGASVSWDQKKNTVMLEKGDKIIEISVGNQTATINKTPYPLDAGAIVKEQRIFVPLRFVSEAFGYDVQWQESAVYLTERKSSH